MSGVLRTSSCSGRNTCADDGGHRAFDWRCDSSSMSTAVTLRLRSIGAQTFFVVDDMKAMYRLDGIVTVVDAAHVECISTKRS